MNLIAAKNLILLSEKSSDDQFDHTDSEILIKIANQKNCLAFERQAISAARNGMSYLVVQVPPIHLSHLLKIGFSVRDLARNDALLRTLELAADSAEYRAIESADRFIFANPNFGLHDKVDFSHRNPLYALLIKIWDQGRVTEQTTTLEFELILKANSNASDDLILSNRFLLKSMVDDFKTFKMAKIQSEPIKRDHKLLPSAVQDALLISWEHVSSDLKVSTYFCPGLLNWYSTHWSTLIDWLNSIMTIDAEHGLNYSAFDVSLSVHGLSFIDVGYGVPGIIVKPFPCQILWRELCAAGLMVIGEVHRFDGHELTNSQSIDEHYEFDLSEDDVLSFVVCWDMSSQSVEPPHDAT